MPLTERNYLIHSTRVIFRACISQNDSCPCAIFLGTLKESPSLNNSPHYIFTVPKFLSINVTP